MKIVKVNESKGITASVGQYESVRMDYNIEATLDEGEDYDMVAEMCNEMLDEKINDRLLELQPILSKTSMFKDGGKPIPEKKTVQLPPEQEKIEQVLKPVSRKRQQ